MRAPDLRDAFVGTWRLVDSSVYGTDGARHGVPFGESPSGQLIYTRSGTMAVLISYGDRPRLSVGDRVAAPPDERADAFATFLSYAGRYTVADGEVTHHLDVASVENWVGIELVRTATLEGNRLILLTPPMAFGGRERIIELVWERVGRE